MRCRWRYLFQERYRRITLQKMWMIRSGPTVETPPVWLIIHVVLVRRGCFEANGSYDTGGIRQNSRIHEDALVVRDVHTDTVHIAISPSPFDIHTRNFADVLGRTTHSRSHSSHTSTEMRFVWERIRNGTRWCVVDVEIWPHNIAWPREDVIRPREDVIRPREDLIRRREDVFRRRVGFLQGKYNQEKNNDHRVFVRNHHVVPKCLNLCTIYMMIDDGGWLLCVMFWVLQKIQNFEFFWREERNSEKLKFETARLFDDGVDSYVWCFWVKWRETENSKFWKKKISRERETPNSKRLDDWWRLTLVCVMLISSENPKFWKNKERENPWVWNGSMARFVICDRADSFMRMVLSSRLEGDTHA